jgi:hypothetical protein
VAIAELQCKVDKAAFAIKRLSSGGRAALTRAPYDTRRIPFAKKNKAR